MGALPERESSKSPLRDLSSILQLPCIADLCVLFIRGTVSASSLHFNLSRHFVPYCRTLLVYPRPKPFSPALCESLRRLPFKLGAGGVYTHPGPTLHLPVPPGVGLVLGGGLGLGVAPPVLCLPPLGWLVLFGGGVWGFGFRFPNPPPFPAPGFPGPCCQDPKERRACKRTPGSPRGLTRFTGADASTPGCTFPLRGVPRLGPHLGAFTQTCSPRLVSLLPVARVLAELMRLMHLT